MNLFDLYAKISLDDSEYESGLKDAQGKASSFGEKLKSGLATAGKIAAGAIGVATTAITALGKVAFSYNSEIESYTTNFTVMLGDAEKAARKVEELKKLGASTPFEMGDLANATQTLLAFNVSADDSTAVLQNLGDISLGNVQKLESLTRAYGKMNAAQKVSLEDINMMIDAGFNPLLIVAENTGESMEQLYDRVSKGEVAFSEIQNAIDLATSAGGQYYKGMEQASKTTQGLISTLKDNAQALVGKVFAPISNGLKDKLLPAAIKAIEDLTTAYEEKGIEGMIAAAGEIVGQSVAEFAANAPRLIDSGVLLIEELAQGISNNEDAITSGAADTFFAFVDGVTKLIPTLLGTAVGLVTGFGGYIIENPDKVIEAGGELLLNIGTAIAEAIPELLVTAIGVVTSLGTYIYENRDELWDNVVAAGSRICDAVWSGIQAGWSNLTSKVQQKLRELGNYIMDYINRTFGGSFMVGGEFIAPGPSNTVITPNAGGLDYVPYNGYISELHRGEMVLTSAEASAYRRGGQNGSIITFGDIIINCSGSSYPNEEEVRQIAEMLQFEIEKEALALG